MSFASALLFDEKRRTRNEKFHFQKFPLSDSQCGLICRITLFTSDKLPLTVVWTKDADEVYQYSLGTEVLRVPHSGASRIARWPGLKAAPRPFTLFSESENVSGADLTLSSTGKDYEKLRLRCSSQGELYNSRITPVENGRRFLTPLVCAGCLLTG